MVLDKVLSLRFADSKFYTSHSTRKIKGTIYAVKYQAITYYQDLAQTHADDYRWLKKSKNKQLLDKSKQLFDKSKQLFDKYVGVKSRKNKQNTALIAATLSFVGALKNKHALLIDAADANSSRAAKDAGMPPANIHAVNYSPAIAEKIAQTGVHAICGSSTLAIAQLVFEKKRLALVYLDYCGMCKKTEQTDIRMLFEGKALAAQAVLSVTFCTRTLTKKKRDYETARFACRFIRKTAKDNGYKVVSNTPPAKSHYTEKGKQTMCHLVFKIRKL
jgi:hypothetical protein